MKRIARASELPQDRPIHILGAGGGGQALCRALLSTGTASVAGFVDVEKTGKMMGLPIQRTVDFVRREGCDCTVVIATQHHAEAAATLRVFGFVHVYDGYPLVRHLLGLPGQSDATPWRAGPAAFGLFVTAAATVLAIIVAAVVATTILGVALATGALPCTMRGIGDDQAADVAIPSAASRCSTSPAIRSAPSADG